MGQGIPASLKLRRAGVPVLPTLKLRETGPLVRREAPPLLHRLRDPRVIVLIVLNLIRVRRVIGQVLLEGRVLRVTGRIVRRVPLEAPALRVLALSLIPPLPPFLKGGIKVHRGTILLLLDGPVFPVTAPFVLNGALAPQGTAQALRGVPRVLGTVPALLDDLQVFPTLKLLATPRLRQTGREAGLRGVLRTEGLPRSGGPMRSRLRV